MANSALSFLLPQLDGTFSGTVQIVFALVFLAAVIVIPLRLRATARPAAWEHRLTDLGGGDPNNFPYDTPEELSQAVATPAERWAELLPALLLVLGLLGTFVSLGLALGDAAGVLEGRHGVSGLMPVIDTLGAKFKISTWGILAFLFLRLWSIAFAHEQARLDWSARVIKARTDSAAQLQADEQRKLTDALIRSGNALLAAQQAEAQRAHVRHGELLDALQALSGRPIDRSASARPDVPA